jgi:N utilization substance protein B
MGRIGRRRSDEGFSGRASHRRVAVGKRHQARELALKVLFQLEGTGDDPEEVLRYHASENGATEDIASFARELVRGVLDNQQKLDALLSEASEHWKLEQMAKVDRAILRIAVYEIAIDRKVPTKAAINESIELAKTFSGDEAGRFVNGILGRVAATAT